MCPQQAVHLAANSYLEWRRSRSAPGQLPLQATWWGAPRMESPRVLRRLEKRRAATEWRPTVWPRLTLVESLLMTMDRSARRLSFSTAERGCRRQQELAHPQWSRYSVPQSPPAKAATVAHSEVCSTSNRARYRVANTSREAETDRSFLSPWWVRTDRTLTRPW